jgi:hypothetical protein
MSALLSGGGSQNLYFKILISSGIVIEKVLSGEIGILFASCSGSNNQYQI